MASWGRGQGKVTAGTYVLAAWGKDMEADGTIRLLFCEPIGSLYEPACEIIVALVSTQATDQYGHLHSLPKTFAAYIHIEK